MTHLVAFTGYARSGKTTAAKELGWKRIAFADVLKKDCASIIAGLGLDPDKDKERCRSLWVEVGRWCRKQRPDYYIERLHIPDGDCVIDDLRYQNECKHVLGRGGLVIRINRPGFGPVNEEEERSIDAILADTTMCFDVIDVQNVGTVEQLGRKVREVVANYFHRV